MRRLLNVVSVFILLLASACSNPYKRRCSQWLPLFHEPAKAQEKQFLGYDLPTQYEVYTCGMRYIEPPLMQFAPLLARKGKDAVGFLQTKLAEAPDDRTVVDLVMVFSWMQESQCYNVASDRDLMSAIGQGVDGMTDNRWKRIAVRDMERIRDTPARSEPPSKN